ncbi:biotin/lipoyl-containing protein [Propionimicrobium lymphophilum]|uniref:biotin/lipoyl-containing protein n=1 Tax=Propionimicrobium lymphophilum TaxID=33012 RepID=UPI003EC536B3
MRLKMTVNGNEYVVDVEQEPEVCPVPGPIVIGGGAAPAAAAPAAAAAGGAGPNDVTAPLAGSVARFEVAEGDKVEAGQVVVVLEAMKMETEIAAPKAGTVTKLLAEVRQAVQGGQPLLTIE